MEGRGAEVWFPLVDAPPAPTARGFGNGKSSATPPNFVWRAAEITAQHADGATVDVRVWDEGTPGAAPRVMEQVDVHAAMSATGAEGAAAAALPLRSAADDALGADCSSTMDMSALSHLNEPTVMHFLKQQHLGLRPYCYSGATTIALKQTVFWSERQ